MTNACKYFSFRGLRKKKILLRFFFLLPGSENCFRDRERNYFRDGENYFHDFLNYRLVSSGNHSGLLPGPGCA